MAVGVPQEEAATLDAAIEVGELYERYQDRLLAYCAYMLRDRAEAEDAVQTTFLYAQRALQRGVKPERELAWLRTIAKNVCRMQLRTAARRAAVTGVDLDQLPGRDSGAADDRELLVGLDAALASLPDGQRRALLLREWHGLSSEEVASRLGLTPPATYALLTRARRSLARALTSLPSRPALGLNFGPLLLRLKTLVGGGVAKVATATAVVTAVAAGGVTAERALADRAKRSEPAGVPASVEVEGSSAATMPAERMPVVRTSPARETSPVGSNERRRGERLDTLVPSEPTAHDTPAPPAAPRDEPMTSSEVADAADAPGSVVDTLGEVIDDTVDQLPLPEPDLDVVTDIVPDEPLPDLVEPTLTEPVTTVEPLPPLPPPELPRLP